jgi:hypothetical protein
VDRVLRDVLSLELKHCGQLEKTRVARVPGIARTGTAAAWQWCLPPLGLCAIWV